MSDIVDRLEIAAQHDTPHDTLMSEAADEITKLRAENERLRAALALFACDCTVNERCAVPDNCRNFQARKYSERTHDR